MTRTEGNFVTMVYISKKEIVEAINKNDCKAIIEMLEGSGFSKGDTPPHFVPAARDFLTTLLATAAASAAKGTLDKKIAEILIEHAAIAVRVFNFILPARVYLEPTENLINFGDIPKDIRKAIKEDNTSKKILNKISSLEKNRFVLLIDYLLSGEVETISSYFTPTILRYFYEIIPDGLFFALMATSLKEPVSEIGIGMIDLGGLMSMLDSVCVGNDDDDEEDENESCTCDESCSEGGRCGKCGECENN